MTAQAIILGQTHFLASFSSNVSIYWLAMLLLSAVMMSFAAVGIPASFHQRHHNGLLALNEFLASIQLGLLTYYFAMLLETDFGGNKWLQVLLFGLVLASFVCIVVGSKSASPAIQEQLLEEDHKHPQKFPPPKCTQPVARKTKWRLCRLNFITFVFTFGTAIVVPFLLPASLPVPKYPDYSGEWSGHIDWSPEWASRLFDYAGETNQEFCGCQNAPKFISANPHSDGTIVIYRAQAGYKSISTWQLINGEKLYADVAVESYSFQLDDLQRLTRFEMRTKFRAPRIKYYYAPYYHYYVKLTSASETTLAGNMIAIDDKNKNIEVVAGKINLELTSKKE